MKSLNRKLAERFRLEFQNEPSTSQRETEGHLHENYRHWNWFKPSDNQRAQ